MTDQAETDARLRAAERAAASSPRHGTTQTPLRPDGTARGPRPRPQGTTHDPNSVTTGTEVEPDDLYPPEGEENAHPTPGRD